MNGSLVRARSAIGVYEIGPLTGIYGANITFPDQFNGTVLWDTGQGDSTVYASEEQNFTNSAVALAPEIQSIKDVLSTDLVFVKDMIGGRWCIDHEAFQMVFYKGDNTTEIARFNLRDKNSNPSFLSVFDRNRVS